MLAIPSERHSIWRVLGWSRPQNFDVPNTASAAPRAGAVSFCYPQKAVRYRERLHLQGVWPARDLQPATAHVPAAAIATVSAMRMQVSVGVKIQRFPIPRSFEDCLTQGSAKNLRRVESVARAQSWRAMTVRSEFPEGN